MIVSVFCEFGTISGGENSLLTLLPFVLEADVKLRLFVPPLTPLAEKITALGLDCHSLDWSRTSVCESANHLVDHSMQCRKRETLKQFLLQFPCDLIHANSLSMGRLIGPIARQIGIPSISHLRDIIRLSATAAADLSQNNRLLAVSEATRRFHLEQIPQIDTSLIHVLYNGIDTSLFRPRPATGYLHRELGLPKDAILIAAIGQIGLRKGLDFLLESLVPVMESRKNLHLLIVGERWSNKEESHNFESALHKKASKPPFCSDVVGTDVSDAGLFDSSLFHSESLSCSSLSDSELLDSNTSDANVLSMAASHSRGRIHFLGHRNDIPILLNELTLLVHAARQEPLGRILLEAAASGLPIIATKVGGTTEIFSDFLSGSDEMKQDMASASAFIVQSESTSDMQRAFFTILDSAILRDQLGKNARNRIKSRFSHEKAATELLRHYSEVVKNRHQ
ncbi:MAG: glycosyltransferase family 4 protein [Thermoguttaceae bacterium]